MRSHLVVARQVIHAVQLAGARDHEPADSTVARVAAIIAADRRRLLEVVAGEPLAPTTRRRAVDRR